MDLSYFGIEDEAPAVNDPNQIRDEMSQLYNVANKIGSYNWSYKEDFSKAPDNEDHMGIVAQQLLQVPGLEAAVSEDPSTGKLIVNTNYVACAALGLVAALARVVLNTNISTNLNNGETDGTTNTELSTELPDSETPAIGEVPAEFTEGANEETAPETESGTDDQLSELGSVQTTGPDESIGNTTSPS